MDKTLERYLKGCVGTLIYLLKNKEYQEALEFLHEIYLNGWRDRGKWNIKIKE